MQPCPRAGRRRLLFSLAAAFAVACSLAETHAPEWRPEIPRTWDEAALATLELPNAATGAPARHVDADFYYRIPATTIYRSYPVYHPDHEPPGYLERLAAAEPEVVVDPTRLHTKADWIAAGEHVFHWPIALRPVESGHLDRMRANLARVPIRPTKDGVLPYQRYVVRERGVVEVGNQSCASCHTRVLPDGTTIVGAQGDLPFDRAFAAGAAGAPREQVLPAWTTLFGMPAVAGVAPPFPLDLTVEQMTAALEAIPPGVLARHGTSPTSPVQVPDLIGIGGRRYLDRTGLVRHRGIGDLMRYAALNQDLDLLSDYAGFVPELAGLDAIVPGSLPPEAPSLEQLRAEARDPTRRFRYSDEQLYALALFLLELRPPPPRHGMDDLARRGREVFAAEDCARCHTPPLYTSNELVPVPGFRVPPALAASERIRSRGVGTDGTLALTTRRGTGFYKVPSLLGVWYRGPFGHSGSAATLEEWFDPARLRDDHMPQGWNPGRVARAIPGHEFGLDLPPEDRAALIAFLKTL